MYYSFWKKVRHSSKYILFIKLNKHKQLKYKVQNSSKQCKLDLNWNEQHWKTRWTLRCLYTQAVSVERKKASKDTFIIVQYVYIVIRKSNIQWHKRQKDTDSFIHVLYKSHNPKLIIIHFRTFKKNSWSRSKKIFKTI